MPRRRTAAAPEEGTPEATAAAPEEGLVAMTKGEAVLHVHHTCVQAHKNAGWKVTE